MRAVLVMHEAVKRSIEVLWWTMVLRVAPPVRDQGAQEDEQSRRSAERNQGDNHPGQRVPYQYHVRIRRERGGDRLRVVRERCVVLVGGHVHGDG